MLRRRDVFQAAAMLAIAVVAAAAAAHFMPTIQEKPSGCEKCGAELEPMDGFEHILNCTKCDWSVQSDYQQ